MRLLLYRRLKKHLLDSRVIYADETVVQVLKEDGKPASSEALLALAAKAPSREFRELLEKEISGERLDKAMVKHFYYMLNHNAEKSVDTEKPGRKYPYWLSCSSLWDSPLVTWRFPSSEPCSSFSRCPEQKKTGGLIKIRKYQLSMGGPIFTRFRLILRKEKEKGKKIQIPSI